MIYFGIQDRDPEAAQTERAMEQTAREKICDQSSNPDENIKSTIGKRSRGNLDQDQ